MVTAYVVAVDVVMAVRDCKNVGVEQYLVPRPQGGVSLVDNKFNEIAINVSLVSNNPFTECGN